MALLDREFIAIWIKTAIGQFFITLLLSATLSSTYFSYKVGNTILFGLAIIVFAVISFGCLKHMDKIEGTVSKLIAFYFVICPITDFIQKAYEINFGSI